MSADISLGADGILHDGEQTIHHCSVRRIWCLDRLPGVRCFLYGPRWRSHFGVERRSLDDVRPPWADRVRANRRWVLRFTLEQDVRELVQMGAGAWRGEEIRPGVFAQW